MKIPQLSEREYFVEDEETGESDVVSGVISPDEATEQAAEDIISTDDITVDGIETRIFKVTDWEGTVTRFIIEVTIEPNFYVEQLAD